MIYTDHALRRFAERYPDLDLVDEEKTFRPATRQVMKKLVKTLKPGTATVSSSRVKGGGRIFVSKNGAVAVVSDLTGKDVVVTFYTNPDNVWMA